jgi:poly(A) polymerase
VNDLSGADWLCGDPVRRVIAALEAEGGAGCARFVGGCVRNTLLGAAVDDVDIATQLTPPRVIAALEAAGIKAVPTGVEHGTVTAVADHTPFEITTLRRDVETDGRRAVVAFTTDWAEDAARRDFRLNALYADPQGCLYDPTGGGLEDAHARRIVFVGEPEQRIREDYLRILRFFRFHAWYGRAPADGDGLAACKRLAEGVRTLSAERVSKELLKLLAAPDPRAALALMDSVGVLERLLDGFVGLGRLNHLVEIDGMRGFEADPLLRLAALLPPGREGALATAAALRLSNAQRDRLEAALAEPAPDVRAAAGAAARAEAYRVSGGALGDRLRLAWASGLGGSEEDFGQWLKVARNWSPPAFPVTGEDLLRAGMARGPEVGRALRELERIWIESDFSLGREALLQRLPQA